MVINNRLKCTRINGKWYIEGAKEASHMRRLKREKLAMQECGQERPDSCGKPITE